jgi:2-polyprenyl-3-methyl-5-hydroxy-6-metoxy-1,4-benzoquinol methylase
MDMDLYEYGKKLFSEQCGQRSRVFRKKKAKSGEREFPNRFERFHHRWITRFEKDGESSGGTYDAMKDPLLDRFFRCFPIAGTILDMGSMEGGHALSMAQRPGVDRVVGIEGCLSNIKKARLAREIFGIKNITYIHADLERLTFDSLGFFDAVFCADVLHLLSEPWRVLEEVAKVSGHLFLRTHYVSSSENLVQKKYRGKILLHLGVGIHGLDGLSLTSFRPTKDELIRMLEDAGFKKIQIIEENPDRQNAPCITLAASVG